ncbi:hypothetical protein [Cyanobium sp. Cruz-8D1]|nr:hypothetical protein [Cyanobium sp. Cruz-8D1]
MPRACGVGSTRSRLLGVMPLPPVALGVLLQGGGCRGAGRVC